jgi:AcrR family transcriptional regulator
MNGTNSAACRPSRGRPKTVDQSKRREDILHVAFTTFVELGIMATSVDEVASRCRISKQTFYQFFANKLDLFLAIIVSFRKCVLDLPRPEDENLSVEGALHKIFSIEENRNEELCNFAYMVLYQCDAFPEYSELLHNEALKSRELLAQWLELQNRRGTLCVDQPYFSAIMLIAMMFTPHGPPKRGAPTWPNPEARNTYQKNCISLFLKGCAPFTAAK